MTQRIAEKVRKDILHINSIHISKLKKQNKLRSQCGNSKWRDIGHTDLILRTTPLKHYEPEAQKFRLKFATL